MNPSDQKKCKLAHDALDAFFRQFGEPSDYNRVALEVIMAGLYGEEIIHLLDKEKQDGSEGSNEPPGGQELPTN